MESIYKNDVKANLVENKTLIENGKIYLYLAYRLEDKDGYYKKVFPRIKLPFSMNSIPNVCVVENNWNTRIECYVEDNCGNKYQLNPDESKNLYYKYCIERKMTLSDIEKELGYKVKIIDE